FVFFWFFLCGCVLVLFCFGFFFGCVVCVVGCCGFCFCWFCFLGFFVCVWLICWGVLVFYFLVFFLCLFFCCWGLLCCGVGFLLWVGWLVFFFCGLVWLGCGGVGVVVVVGFGRFLVVADIALLVLSRVVVVGVVVGVGGCVGGVVGGGFVGWGVVCVC
ncbi:hypothetical protein, partial [Pseudomonas syringae group genomosp. 7]|uniref:hypothetical protein n=1 Tax=Pseudomonas syringae group genomosp. 7 TaxID=251699 RepID=UPI00376FF120